MDELAPGLTQRPGIGPVTAGECRELCHILWPAPPRLLADARRFEASASWPHRRGQQGAASEVAAPVRFPAMGGEHVRMVVAVEVGLQEADQERGQGDRAARGSSAAPWTAAGRVGRRSAGAPVPRALASNADPMTAVVSARRGVRSRTSAPIPLETVRTMARIIEEVESDPTAAVQPLRRADRTQPGLLVQAARDIAACRRADGLDATALVAFTLSGNTVRRPARLHRGRPLIAITPNPALTESARAELGDGARPRRGRRVVRCDGADRRPGGAGVGRIRPG